MEDEGLRNKIKVNSGVRSWRFYRSSTRLPVFENVARVALWVTFCLGAGWYPRLERFFGKRMTSEYHFPEKGTRDSYVLRLIAVFPQPGCLE